MLFADCYSFFTLLLYDVFGVAAEAALALEGADGDELLLHGEYAAEVEAEGIAEGPAFPVQDIK